MKKNPPTWGIFACPDYRVALEQQMAKKGRSARNSFLKRWNMCQFFPNLRGWWCHSLRFQSYFFSIFFFLVSNRKNMWRKWWDLSYLPLNYHNDIAPENRAKPPTGKAYVPVAASFFSEVFAVSFRECHVFQFWGNIFFFRKTQGTDPKKWRDMMDFWSTTPQKKL